MQSTNENVMHPAHYANKKIEVIDYIFDTLGNDGSVDYCLGNVIKYVSRWRLKGGIEDLEKASVYLEWAIEQAKSIESKPCEIEWPKTIPYEEGNAQCT